MIWTRVAVSISDDDNHYTMGTTLKYLGVNCKTVQRIRKELNESIVDYEGTQLWSF